MTTLMYFALASYFVVLGNYELKLRSTFRNNQQMIGELSFFRNHIKHVAVSMFSIFSFAFWGYSRELNKAGVLTFLMQVILCFVTIYSGLSSQGG
ncbi:hypothetical protein HII17_09085 [Thalassotalea sp. M1531]|uniref:Uncharacterized protein n=1 Tax=Thalassotalea algicola TaxID=2716224 RepID=A0A7Y0Q841_9GAMM|nr:hypothetical protein [Thalassotalea algicola]